MSNIINASSSGSGGLITTAADSGTLQLQSNGTTIMTIGATGVTTQVGAPAFSATRESSQSFSSATFTKVLCNTEGFDTNSNYDTTNARFTPTVAGYYQLNGTITITSTSTNNRQILAFFKNNSQILRPVDTRVNYGVETAMFSGTGLVYMNGTTDYVELFLYAQGAGTLTIIAQGPGEYSTFSGFLARSA
ncbi:C1q domain containing protein [uncultured Caudovirales phage]|uniref:C1q domain containing protein n=1 Tax=uncultured Caudovirales phage TaxID=2100421 RepID=A0A6J5LXC1_9CAUD|nr:C1q domain containing protein [uncultured Caudovirales phage]